MRTAHRAVALLVAGAMLSACSASGSIAPGQPSFGSPGPASPQPNAIEAELPGATAAGSLICPEENLPFGLWAAPARSAGEQTQRSIEGESGSPSELARELLKEYEDEPELALSVACGILTLDDESLRARLTPEQRALLDEDEPVVAPGTTIQADPTTWSRVGSLAYIDILMVEADGTSEPYRMTLAHDGQDWVIVGTRWLG